MNRQLKVIVYAGIVLLWAGNLYAECDCLQPFYKDKIDLLTRYTACLEKCYNSKLATLESQIGKAESRISELEAEVDRLSVLLKALEDKSSKKISD